MSLIKTIEDAKVDLVLNGEKLCLRAMKVDDINQEYIDGLNDPEVNKYLVSIKGVLQTRKMVEAFVLENTDNPLSILFGIFAKDDSLRLIGTVRISSLSIYNYHASVGVCVFMKRFWKQGYAQEAVSLVKDFAFQSLELHYLEAGVYADNTNSMRMFLRAGFYECYRIRNKYRLENSFAECVMMGVVNKSFDMDRLQS